MRTIPIVHKIIYERMINECCIGNYLDLHKAREIINRTRIPKDLIKKIMEEMEMLGFIEKINQKKIKVKTLKI